MSQNKYMAVSLTETKADTKKAKSVSQNYKSSGDASVEALNREFGIYKRENEIAMDELRNKIRVAAKSGGGSGEAGKDGVGIKSIEQTVTSTESGGENKIEITLTNDQKEEFTVRNGEKGDPGTAENITPESIGALPVNLPSCPTTSVKDVTTTGRYYCWGCTDLPQGVGTYGYLEVFIHPTTTNHRYLRYTSATEEGTWERSTFDGSTWTEWRRLATTDTVHMSKSLVGNEDLNTITNEGEYYYGWWQETIQNSPVHSAFHLSVERISADEVSQTYTAYTGGSNEVWFRQSTNGKTIWSAWKKIATTDQIPTTAANVGAVPTIATYITSANTDFNLDTGTDSFYIIQSSLIPNCPISGQYVFVRQLFFKDATATSSRTQIMYPYGYPNSVMPTNGLAIRVYCNGVWSAWKNFATTDYAVNKAGDTITGKIYTSATNGAFGSSSDNSAIRIDGGTSYDKGAFLTLYGKDNAGTSGGFQLVASNNDSTRKELRGYPDGTLTWSGNNIYHTGNKPTADAVGALKRGTYERIQGTAEAHKNLNDYTLPGFYNVKTAYVDNCPAGIGIDAVLLVYPWDNNIYNMQEITETAASPMCRRWTRHSNAGTWTAWKAVITEDSKSLISAADVGARPNTWLPTPADIGAIDAFVGYINGTDIKFDTAFTQGEYQVASNNETSDTPPHSLNGGYAYGKLIVTISDGGSYNGSYNWMWQTYYPTSGGAPYIRSKINNGAFSLWQRIATTDYIDEQILKGEW